MHWNWRVTADKYGVSLGWWKCSKITVVMVVQLCDYTKYHWVVHLKLVNNVIDELSLNEAFKKIHIFWPGVTLAYLLGAMREGFNVTSKALKPGFNSTWTVIFQMFKLDLEKAEETDLLKKTSQHPFKSLCPVTEGGRDQNFPNSITQVNVIKQSCFQGIWQSHVCVYVCVCVGVCVCRVRHDWSDLAQHSIA